LIKYIGSKRVLVPEIVERVRTLGDGVRTVLDLFSGTARVGHALKRAGYRVTTNDHNAYAWVLGRCYVQADRREVLGEVEQLVAEANRIAAGPGQSGWFTETYCEKSRYFHPKNGARIEAVREWIAGKGLAPDVEAVLLVSLMEAADRVDSTVGVQMAYLKQWASRAHNDLELRVPEMADGPGTAWAKDAEDAAAAGEWDVVYLDPPYNQHRYLGNYHVWETLVQWDHPEVYGTAMKRVACRDYKSAFNRRGEIAGALRRVVEKLRAKHLIVSFNDEGYLDRPQIESLLGELGEVTTHTFDFKRYVGAKIGIFNPKGEKVGRVSHLTNHELLYVVRC
jgi:adenine-specific DNA-methyltransferase